MERQHNQQKILDSQQEIFIANVGYAGGAEPGGNSGDGVGGGGGGAGGVGLPGTAPSDPERSAGGPGLPNSITGSDVTYCQGGRSHPLGGNAPHHYQLLVLVEMV